MINGIINVYKEKGYTSHDVVAKLRGILKQKKIGHTGTLDPDATGVLPVCLGKATKLCDMLTDKSKTYETVLLLGITTDTQDISGKILSEDTPDLSNEEVKKAIMEFEGDYNQIPPMFSALKVNGKKLYELAREGKVIERQSRKVSIHSIVITDITLPRVRMTVSCSKGTYIRTLCHDIGKSLGCGGCMESLLRTRVSDFRVDNSLTLDKIEELRDENKLQDYIIPIDSMFSGFPSVVVAREYNKLIYNGNCFMKEHLLKECIESMVRVYDEESNFIGIYEYVEEKDYYKPIKIFFGSN